MPGSFFCLCSLFSYTADFGVVVVRKKRLVQDTMTMLRLIIFKIRKPMTPFFSSKPACRKFFTYATKTLDFSGLSAGLSSSELADFDFKLGQFKLSPEFVKVSEKLMLMDLQQYDLCQTIANIRDKSERDRMFTQLAEIKMEMMRMAEHPEAYESRELNLVQSESKLKPAEGTREILGDSPASNSGKNIMLLLDNPATIGDALLEAAKLPFRGEDRFLFNQKRQRYQTGMSDYERLNWIGEIKCFLAKYIEPVIVAPRLNNLPEK